MFLGKLTPASIPSVGLPFLNFKWLQSQYNLEMLTDGGEVENFDGEMKVTIWKKKTHRQLEKERAQSSNSLMKIGQQDDGSSEKIFSKGRYWQYDPDLEAENAPLVKKRPQSKHMLDLAYDPRKSQDTKLEKPKYASQNPG
jgi:hypothetical protein